jgi:hypothetical protein
LIKSWDGVQAKIALLTSKGSVCDIPMKNELFILVNNEYIGLTNPMSVSTYIPPNFPKISSLNASALNPGFKDLSLMILDNVNS